MAVSDARLQLESTITRINSLLGDLDLEGEVLQSRVFVEVEERFSFYHIARRSVGRQWGRFSQQEQEAFVDSFSQLLFRTYFGYLQERHRGVTADILIFTVFDL